MLDSIYWNGSVSGCGGGIDSNHVSTSGGVLWGFGPGRDLWSFTLCCSARRVAKDVCVCARPRVLACVSGGLNTIKNVIHNQGLVAGLLGKPSTTSVCVITQLRGRKRNGASKSKHWPAAFLNAIFPFTPMNFYCPHWLQLFITGSADECTRWHLHWRKWPPEPIKWSSTHLQRATSSPVLLSFKDLATSVVWWVTASCSCYLCLDSQTCVVKKMIPMFKNVRFSLVVRPQT